MPDRLTELVDELKSARHQQNWLKVRDFAAELTELQPAAVIYHILRAQAHLNLQDHNAARHIIEAASERFPDNESVWVNRVEILSVQMSPEKTIAMYADLLERFPDSYGALASAARAYHRLEQDEQALAFAQKALELRYDPALQRVLVSLHSRRGGWEDAVEAAKILCETVGTAPGDYRQAITPLLRLGRHDEALTIMCDWLECAKGLTPVDYEIAADLFVKASTAKLREQQKKADLALALLCQPRQYQREPGLSALSQQMHLLYWVNRESFENIIQYLADVAQTMANEPPQELRETLYALGMSATGPDAEALREMSVSFGFEAFWRCFSGAPLHEHNCVALLNHIKTADVGGLLQGNGQKNLRIFVGANRLANPKLAEISALASLLPAPLPRAASGKRRRSKVVRIAVCVSGQLRGYEQAAASWKTLGFDTAKTDFYVHSWKSIGRKYPNAPHAHRCFSAHFLDVYKKSLVSHSVRTLEAMYSSLYQAFRAEGNATEAQIKSFYGARDVVLEDDTESAFQSFNNPMKMYYKIQKAWEMCDASGQTYDLIVRIRPDREITAPKPVDWATVHAACSAEPILYCDGAFSLRPHVGFMLGDQFAVSTPDVMREYSRTFDKAQNPAHPMRDYLQIFLPHANLAFSTFFAGIQPRRFNHANFGQLFDPAPLSPAFILSCIQKDTAARMEFELDAVWQSALQADIRVHLNRSSGATQTFRSLD